MKAAIRKRIGTAPPADCLSAQEVAHATGATLRQLQWWDENGYMKPAHGVWKNNRVYSLDQLPVIAKMVALKRAGVGLALMASCIKLGWNGVFVVDRPMVLGDVLLVPPPRKRSSPIRKGLARIVGRKEEDYRLEQIALRDPVVARGRAASL